MAQDRPDVPTALRRSVLVEAGHRCALPTCRQTPVELAHLTPWSKVREHTFANLIALCPTCHTRYDRGDIDRQSMLQYKANLELIRHRYTDIERQLLKSFVRKFQSMRTYFPTLRVQDMYTVTQSGQLRIHADMWWMVTNLIDDGIIKLCVEDDHAALKEQDEERNTMVVLLTTKGREFLARWMAAEPF